MVLVSNVIADLFHITQTFHYHLSVSVSLVFITTQTRCRLVYVIPISDVSYSLILKGIRG